MSEFSDRLTLRGMHFDARHGVLPHEKVEAQPFEVDLVLHADLSEAARTDALADTVDYAGLFDLVRAIVTGPSFDLIEALADAVARAVLAATDPRLVDAVEVRVRKPRAPIDGQLDTVEAALVRRRLEARGPAQVSPPAARRA
jgi:dihydroneopterin aldolase